MEIPRPDIRMAPAEKRWVLYLLECGDSTLYTGVTNDLRRRLKRHRAGKGARYTRGRLPVKLVYIEQCEDRGVALQREYTIKRYRRREKLALIEKTCRAKTGDAAWKKG